MADNSSTEIVKTSRDGRWLIAKKKNMYYFFDTAAEPPKPVRTPRGELLRTSYYQLAERILDDLVEYGTKYMGAESVLPWHFTMVDNFVAMEHERVEAILSECFMQKYDWTCSTEYEEVFGDAIERLKEIRQWLSKCTHMQMTAACCIGNAYNSLNVAYVLALLMENSSGHMLKKQMKMLAEIVEENSMYDDVESILRVFDTFQLYYGIHNEENGPIINEEFSMIDEEDGGKEIAVTEEMLIGRNFYHYTDGECDEEQPFVLATDLSDIEGDVEEEDEDFDEEDKDEDETETDEELDEYLPRDCWLKKISAFEDDEEIYYIIAIEVENGIAKNISIIKDEVQRSGGGMFFIPGMVMPAQHYYEEVDKDDYPEVVEKELDALEKGRYLPNGFSFMGKRLPQAILDRGGNGGDMTDHTYAIQSAYRLAYMHMSVSTTEEGIIEDFSYSTYQSTGSSYGDMFSRPRCINDKHEEIVDMLLYILDLYSEEELKNILFNC